MSLCTHNTDHPLHNYFLISMQFFSPDSPSFFLVSTIHQVIWPNPCTLVTSPDPEPSITVNRYPITHMEQFLHRTADESTYYAPPLGISLLRTTTNCYFSGQLFCIEHKGSLQNSRNIHTYEYGDKCVLIWKRKEVRIQVDIHIRINFKKGNAQGKGG